MPSLVIVESPTKAGRIAGFLGRDFVVEASMGHVRDLPANAAQIPAAYKSEPWARDGVDVDNDFKPLYIVTKNDQVKKLRGLLRNAEALYLATDEDREGESIAWHLLEVLGPQVPVRRMVFHEITESAIRQAIAEPRDVDMRLVDAQETRRILDRLYGYRLSEVLWRKSSGRSAGRVQSVASRLLVERERERIAFRAATWWDIEGTFAPRDGAAANSSDGASDRESDGASDRAFGGDRPVGATLAAVDGRRLATGRDFGRDGQLTAEDVVVLDEDAARRLAGGLAGADFGVRSVERKPYRRSPAAPFITSTFQQEASRKLGMTARRAMAAAQRLYEGGYITYMRTDSTTLSATALAAARSEIGRLYGGDYVPERPRVYARKVKNAQEAHEAIRPAGESFRRPDDVGREVGTEEARVYDLVWKRTVASQMPDAVGETVTVRLGAVSSEGTDAEFATSGTVITFPGFRRAYVEGFDDPDAEQADEERSLPALTEGDRLGARELEPKGHTTSPPPRYTEASLTKRLEELGVGRPSTYATIAETILDREYAFKRGTALVPTFLGFAVVQLLEHHFDQYVDYRFTAAMEDDLDRIASGEAERVPWLQRFYVGNGAVGLRTLVSGERLGEIDAAAVNTVPLGEDEAGTPVAVRVGKYGPYVQRGDERASVPPDVAPDELTVDRAVELLEAPSGDRELGTDPESGLQVLARTGRFGPYVQLGEGDPGSKEKPKTASLFKSMSLDSVTLEQALELLRLPRVVGADPADGQDITAQNGRYGPYVSKGAESRSLEREEDIFTVTLEEALALLAQPRRRRGQQTAASLRELGDDPASGQPVVLKEGRYGPYVTDGDVNASLRKDDSVETVTLERAAELLADRRARGPAKKKAARKKSPAKKKAAKKKAAKKKAAVRKKGGA